MADEMGERTERPTSRRMSEARERGQVAKSQDLSGAIDLAAGVVVLVFAGGFLGRSFLALLEKTYTAEGAGWSTDPDSVWPLARAIAIDGARAAAPLLLVTALAAGVAQLVQVGWVLTAKPLKPNFGKLNPISGVKQLFSKRSLMKSILNSFKLVFVLAVAWAVIAGFVPRIIGLPALSAAQGMVLIARMLLALAIWLVAVLLVIGLIDWVYQRWQHTEDLKMTKQQVKDERRSMEGDPQIKGRRLRMMRDIVLQQIQAHVPLADVVVTNPTHFAVALRYDPASMRAPRVVAKGADFMAQRIRLVASANGVPIIERPPLARGLYYGTEPGQEISSEYYEAVAEVLAYVYRLEGESSESGRRVHERARERTMRRRRSVGAAG